MCVLECGSKGFDGRSVSSDWGFGSSCSRPLGVSTVAGRGQGGGVLPDFRGCSVLYGPLETQHTKKQKKQKTKRGLEAPTQKQGKTAAWQLLVCLL
jgi:hypothetical protein